MIVAEKHTNTTNAPSKPSARVELYNGSTPLNNYGETDYLQGFNIERVGEDSKFFGFGVCHKIVVVLGDYEENVDLSGANTLEVAYGVDNDFIYTYPSFKIAEITRDEATKEYTITAYDALAAAADNATAELTLPDSDRTIRDYAVASAGLLGLALKIEGVQDNCFDLSVDYTANLEGTESVRELLNDIAEATQTIYYINNNRELVFKRLDISGAAVATITNDNSMNIIVGDTKTLTGITHATELGDNVSVTTGEDGVMQYVRDNVFWELRDDIDAILDAALANVSGGAPATLGVAKLGATTLGAVDPGGKMSNTAFYADWFGNYLLEVGDKIAIETEGGNTIYSYVLNDVIAYTGIVLEQTQWIYGNGDGEGANSNRLGDALRQTFAKVDKANKRIDLVVSEQATAQENMAQLQITTEAVQIAVTEVKNNGVESVRTTTGYEFSDKGLTVSDPDSEISTLINNEGMTVKRDDTEMLTANSDGVKATDLHARTYLIVGGRSRFENYETDRTACFWIK